MITIDNYEAYLLQYAEGMLSEKDRAEVEAFLKDHPDLREEMEQFYDADLKVTAPDMKMPNKSALKHRLVMPIVWRSAVAACLIGGAVVLGINLITPQQESPMIAKVEIPMQTEEIEQESVVVVEQVDAIEDQNVISKPIVGKIVVPDKVNEGKFEMEETSIMEEEAIEVEEIQDVEHPILVENDQLIAMLEDEPIVIQSDQLIKVVEPVIIQSDDLIDVEAMSLKMVVDQYITTPLKAHAERTKGKVVEQLYAMTDEFKQRYINNFNNPQL